MDAPALVRGMLAEKQVSRGEAAKLVGLSRTAFSKRVNGHVPFLFDEVTSLSASLGVPASELMRRAEQRQTA